jgi:hypothetical protein
MRLTMRLITQGRFGSPSPPDRWHGNCEKPRADAQIEVEVGDNIVWAGVRYAHEREVFIDPDSGAYVPVMRWRYTRPHDW